MDEKAYVVRVPKRWARIALIVLVTTMIVAPLTAWAADSFTDVPDSNIFHEDIEWAKDSGVTKGCNPPANTEFCPKDDVSRETMAAFMHRLAINQVVDADKVDGLDAADLTVTAAADIDSGPFGTTVTEITTVNTVTIEAPVDGVLLISGNVFVNTDTAALIGIVAFVDGTRVGSISALDDMSPAIDDDDEQEQLAYSTAVAVSAGTHTVRHDVGGISGAGVLVDTALFYNVNNLTVLFVPGGTVTSAGTGASSSGSVSGE